MTPGTPMKDNRNQTAKCEIGRAGLQLTFDGESGAPEVAGHVADCDACSSALILLQSQRDAVAYLTSSTACLSLETAVERVLVATAKTGRSRLADLLYEMAKACLVVLPNVKRRIERRIEPRGLSVVANEMRTMASRLGTTDAGVTLLHSGDVSVAESNALAVADSCLHILQNIEGKSERQCLASSQVLIFSGRPAEAEQMLRALLGSANPLRHQDLAEWNVMLALMRQHRHREAVDFGMRALRQRPDDPVILYNIAASHAWLREPDHFEAVSTRLAELLSRSDAGAPEWLISLLRYEAPEFAACFNTTVDEIERKFGLSRSDPRSAT